ncbi:MAG: CpaD family pilus assembly lipoprotein, partial [Pseudomonadota bacterium]
MRSIKNFSLASARALACGLVAGPLLVGCLQSDPNVRWLVADESPPWLWSKEQKPRASNNTVQWTQLSHTIAFAADNKAISREEAARIDRFLTLTRARGDTASIVVAVADTAKGKKLAADRGKSVTGYLARHGVNVGRVSEVPGSSNPNVVTILIGRNIVQTPKCGNWRRALAGNK